MLMVLGHSGCPRIGVRMIYFFHMPLFFVCSGYFFSYICSIDKLRNFVNKKMIGLYLPYIKWSLFFLVLHNCFITFHIYDAHTSYYTYKDIVIRLLKTAMMTDFELLIRPFWFIKELFLGSILIALLSYILKIYSCNRRLYILLLVILLSAISCRYFNVSLPVIGDLSTLLLCSSYFLLGSIYKKHEHQIPHHLFYALIAVFILWAGTHYSFKLVELRFILAEEIPLYYLLSMIGVYATFCVSKHMMNFRVRKVFFYVGTHTMSIFALHILAFKIGSLLKIYYYHLPIEQLADYPVILTYNKYFIFVYILCGILVPLLLGHLYNRLHHIIKTYHLIHQEK